MVRLGSPPNPDAFRPGLTSSTILGQTWDPFVDHTTFSPSAVIDGLALTVAPLNLALPPFGTLLVLPPVGIPLQTGPASAPFALPLPPKCSLAGAALYTQAFSIDSAGDLLLTNALDITLGTF